MSERQELIKNGLDFIDVNAHLGIVDGYKITFNKSGYNLGINGMLIVYYSDEITKKTIDDMEILFKELGYPHFTSITIYKNVMNILFKRDK